MAIQLQDKLKVISDSPKNVH